jgi:hypothetical protein
LALFSPNAGGPIPACCCRVPAPHPVPEASAQGRQWIRGSRSGMSANGYRVSGCGDEAISELARGNGCAIFIF